MDRSSPRPVGRCTERALVPSLPCPPSPSCWGPGRRRGWLVRRRLRSFQIGKPTAAGPQDEPGRSLAAWAVSHRGAAGSSQECGPANRLAGGGRRAGEGTAGLPVTKQDPPCGPLPDPRRLAATLQGAGRTRPLGPGSVPPHSFRQASESREAQRLRRGLGRGCGEK